jgi:cytochrome c oxidase subunit 2
MTRIAKGIPRGVSVVALAAIAMLLVAACGTGVSVLQPPPAVTEQGQATEWLYQIVFIVAVVVFFLVEGLIVYAAIRYRRRKGDDTLPPQIHGNNVLEVIWTAIPVVVVAILFVISWQTLNTVDAVSANPKLKIDVTGFQWQWQFTYPDQGVTLIGLPDKQPELVVPVDETVQVKLESRDVNHGFYVPAFLFKRDVIPGKTNVFDFKATETGVFDGHCTQFCGLLHSKMLFTVRVVTRPEFDAWVAQAKATPTPAPATPAPSASAGTGGGGGGTAQPVALQLSAQNIAYDKTELSAPADTPISLTFVNNDNGIPHDVAIHKDSPTGEAVFTGEIFPGVATKVYDVPALPAGTYAFVCTVHPNMTGTLTVK